MTLEELTEHPEVQACASFNGYDVVWNRWLSVAIFDRDGNEFQLKEDTDADALFVAVMENPESDPFQEHFEAVTDLGDAVQ